MIRGQECFLVLRGHRGVKRREIRQQLLESAPVVVVQVNNRRQLDYLTAWRDIQRKLNPDIRRFRWLLKHLVEGATIVGQQDPLEAHMERPTLALIRRYCQRHLTRDQLPNDALDPH